MATSYLVAFLFRTGAKNNTKQKQKKQKNPMNLTPNLVFLSQNLIFAYPLKQTFLLNNNTNKNENMSKIKVANPVVDVSFGNLLRTN